MNLQKNEKKHSGKYTVGIDKKMHEKIKHLAYKKKTSSKDIIAKAIALYEKSSLFDDLF